MKRPNISVGDYIKRCREEYLHMSQPQFAEALGMDPKKGRSTVNNWETGGIQIKSEDLKKISLTFNVTTDYLLGLTDSPTREGDKQKAEVYTGLSSRAVDQIRSLKENQPREAAALDMLLSSPDFYVFVLWEVAEYYNTQVKTIIDSQEQTERLKSAVEQIRGASMQVLSPADTASYHIHKASFGLSYMLENQEPLWSYNMEAANRVFGKEGL